MLTSIPRATPRRLARRALAFIALVLACLSWQGAAAQSMLQASSTKIVNASGQEVILKGMNLGDWMLQEGYMMKPGFGGTQGSIKKILYDAGMSDAAVETFYQGWRDNFITKPDIDYIASLGFNCIRLPMHYDLFLTPAQRAVRNSVIRGTVTYDSYEAQLKTWADGGQLFQDPSQMEAIRMIENTLSWCAANNMYVVLDLHAAPGAQGSDTNISDALRPNDFWNNPTNQDVATQLWTMLAKRYKNDARVAMYDVLNEPNNVPNTATQNGNQRIHDVLDRFINTIRAQGDNHLILLEGNGYGNNYDYMEKRTFTNQANLVYNSHRYDAPAYPLPNDVNATGGSANQLGLIGNLTRFRTANNVPIWVGETGENTAAWMNEAAHALGIVGIGWANWTYKRFDTGPNAALMHIVPPYEVDGPAGLPQVLENIKFANCVVNPGTVAAVSPNLLGSPAVAPVIGQNIWLRGNNGKYVSSESGLQAMTCTHDAIGTSEQFTVVDGGGGKLALRALGKYVSSENGTQAMTCTRTAITATEMFDILVNPDGTYSLRGSNGQYVSSENGTQPMNCNRAAISTWEAFNHGLVYAGPLATTSTGSQVMNAYPNPVVGSLTYSLPPSTKAHTLIVSDATGRTVLTRSYGNVGAQNTLDTSGLGSGLYVIRLTGADFTQSFKVTKE
ncbi:hypothetical protein A0257_10275 [Hymenobacter psoromatis]|nr:hypothetical protein A0257_10275 [Hymenobacter psoromatis]